MCGSPTRGGDVEAWFRIHYYRTLGVSAMVSFWDSHHRSRPLLSHPWGKLLGIHSWRCQKRLWRWRRTNMECSPRPKESKAAPPPTHQGTYWSFLLIAVAMLFCRSNSRKHFFCLCNSFTCLHQPIFLQEEEEIFLYPSFESHLNKCKTFLWFNRSLVT